MARPRITDVIEALGLALARSARAVVGFELAASSVADARRNAERNGIANARSLRCIRFLSQSMLSLSAAEPMPSRGNRTERNAHHDVRVIALRDRA